MTDTDSDTVPFPTLPPLPTTDGGYRTILADPAWKYDDTLPGPGRGAESHYNVLHEGTMAGMGPQIREVTDSNCHLWLWATHSFLPAAFDIIDAWGFDYKTTVTWVKVQEAPHSLPHERDGHVCTRRGFGMGHYVRSATEYLLFATKGSLGTDENDAVSYFFAEPTEHSAKPEKAYRLVEYLSEGPRLELFAREPRDGWDAWGDEVA